MQRVADALDGGYGTGVVAMHAEGIGLQNQRAVIARDQRLDHGQAQGLVGHGFCIVVDGDGDVLTASERGFGKRTPIEEFPKKGRGTQGVIALKTNERNGALVGAIQLTERHDVLLISDGGTLVRTRAAEIAQVGRNTQGVTLMRLAADEKLQAIERLDATLDADAEGAEAEGAQDGAP